MALMRDTTEDGVRLGRSAVADRAESPEMPPDSTTHASGRLGGLEHGMGTDTLHIAGGRRTPSTLALVPQALHKSCIGLLV